MKYPRFAFSGYLLPVLLLFCYIADIYFVFQDNRNYYLLFFVLHSCLGLLFCLVTLTGREARFAAGTELSYEKDEMKRRLEEMYGECQMLREKAAANAAQLEQLQDECRNAKEAAGSLSRKLAASQKKLETFEQFFPADGQHADARAYSLLPPCLWDHAASDCADIAAIAGEVLELLSSAAINSGIFLRLSAPSAPLPLRVCPQALRTLFFDLIRNSAAHMHRTGSIAITLSSIGEEVLIVCRDEREENEAISIPDNRYEPGSLEFAQANAIVCFYGGRIHAKSIPGHGMTVYIRLPVTEREEIIR